MTELEVLTAADNALSQLEEKAGVMRVLRYLVDKHGQVESDQLLNAQAAPASAGTPKNQEAKRISQLSNELPGIALMTDGGEFKLTVRDPKAANTNDAAIRLALIAIRAYCLLSGEKTASSKKIVKPVLEYWRAYTSNTRGVLARHPGLLREGDALSLDRHAQEEADGFIEQVMDSGIIGSWQPANRRAAGNRSKQTSQ